MRPFLCNALDLYPWGTWFESLPVHRPSLLRLYVVYIGLSRQISGHYLNYTTTGLFQIFCSYSFTYHSTVHSLRYWKHSSAPPPKFNIFVLIFELRNLWKRRSWGREAYGCSLTAVCFGIYWKILCSWWYSPFHKVNLVLNRNVQVRLVCTWIIDFPISRLFKKKKKKERERKRKKMSSEPNVKYSWEKSMLLLRRWSIAFISFLQVDDNLSNRSRLSQKQRSKQCLDSIFLSNARHQKDSGEWLLWTM